MTINRGQCYITRATKTIMSSGDVTINETPQTFAIAGAFGGEIDTRLQSIAHEITFTHDGRLEDALAIMFPHGASRIGQSVFADTALVLTDVNGNRRTYYNAALTRIGAANLTTLGPSAVTLTFTAIPVSTADVIADESSLFLDATGVTFTQPVQDPADILTDLYSAAWGLSPWNAFFAKDGWNLSFNLTLTTETSQRRGINTMTLADMQVTATCIPEDADGSDIPLADIATALKHQGSGAKIGGSMKTSTDLVLTGPNLTFTLKNAGLMANARVFSNTRRQQGDLMWKAHRGANSSGSPATLFTVAATA